jgi:hypothetical protein
MGRKPEWGIAGPPCPFWSPQRATRTSGIISARRVGREPNKVTGQVFKIVKLGPNGRCDGDVVFVVVVEAGLKKAEYTATARDGEGHTANKLAEDLIPVNNPPK